MPIAAPEHCHARSSIVPRPVDIALLGLGRVGAAVARALDSGSPLNERLRRVGALVRNTARPRDRIERALAALTGASRCAASAIRVLEG